MHNNIRFSALAFLALTSPAFAVAYVWFPAYTFKVYADGALYWEGNFKEGEEIKTKDLGLPGMPQCYSSKLVPKALTNVYCLPSLRIKRGKKAAEEGAEVNCDGFLLVEDYIDHWEMVKLNGTTVMDPAKISHHMCIGSGDNINFTGTTSEGWLKQTTYRIEMSKELSKE